MDASTLRWIILAVGVVILAAILAFGSPERKRKPRASRRKALAGAERVEPALETGDAEAGDASDQEPGNQGELPMRAVAPDEPRAEPPPRRPAGPAPEKIVTLFVVARDNHRICGADLLQAALRTGMEFGDMDIFHRHAEGDSRPVFSLANAVKPGQFDREAWNTFETYGVALFMALPGPMLALDAWDSMLATARRMAGILNAEILGADRSPFTRRLEAEVREELRAYDRNRARKHLS